MLFSEVHLMAPVEHGQLQTAVLDPDSRPAKTKQALDANTPPDAMTTIQVPSDFLLKVPDEHKIFEIEPKAPYPYQAPRRYW